MLTNNENIFQLNNEHRKCMGLQLCKSNYDIVDINDEVEGRKRIFKLYFDRNKLVKVDDIWISNECIYFVEKDVDCDTINNRSIVLSRKNNAKNKKLNLSFLNSLNGKGNYFGIFSYFNNLRSSHAIIGNYTTQKTFFEERYLNLKSFDDIAKWCDNYVKNSLNDDIKEVQLFSKENVKHIKYSENDYFRVKFDRHNYLYGRILFDINKQEKLNNFKYFGGLMGHNLIIEIFHILTSRKNMSVDELKELKTFPPQVIMDNKFYYGDCEIIGNCKIDKRPAYPIVYGALSKDEIVFQCGEIRKSIPYNEKDFIGDKNKYYDGGSGFDIIIDNKKVIEKCIKSNSNEPYWDFYGDQYDIRAPKNRKDLINVLKLYNHSELENVYNNND